MNSPVALITGAGTGIGGAVARAWVARGGRVVLTGRRREPLADMASRLGEAALAWSADAADATAVARLVDAAVERFGGLDALIANAGGEGAGSVLEADDAGWQQALQVNLMTAVVAARACLPALIARRGAIVVVSSLAGLAAPPQLAPYTVAKHALVGLTRSLARDFGSSGVRANAVCPGWVRTPMADVEMDALAVRHGLDAGGVPDREAAYALATRHVPLGRAITAEEVAEVICFLASPAAAAINGAVIPVDGGATAVDLPTVDFAHEGRLSTPADPSAPHPTP